jgi:hypothetical protein
MVCGFPVVFVCFWVPSAAYLLKLARRPAGYGQLDINLAIYISFAESIVDGTVYCCAGMVAGGLCGYLGMDFSREAS